MKIVWTAGAANDLTEIVDYISRESAEAARRVAKVIYDETLNLASMPNRGRKRSTDDARELIFAPWPYVAVYEIIDDIVFIEGIRHTARDSWQRT
jgi:addiction module RelE/StbE family toxin